MPHNPSSCIPSAMTHHESYTLNISTSCQFINNIYACFISNGPPTDIEVKVKEEVAMVQGDSEGINETSNEIKVELVDDANAYEEVEDGCAGN